MSNKGPVLKNNNTRTYQNENIPNSDTMTDRWTETLYCCCWCRADSPVPEIIEPNERTRLLSNHDDGSKQINKHSSSYPPMTTMPARLCESFDSDNVNLWNEPFDPSHTECDEDMELSNIIRKRDDAHPGSPEWMQYDLEINSIRQQRRDIEERWKTVLRGLGFVDEVETGILSPISTYSKQHSTISKSVQARDLYGRLVKESAMFSGCRWQGQSQRYLIIIERLIDLETAEDFVEAALELYPREKEYYGEEQDYQDED